MDIEFEGKMHSFPDDVKQEEIAAALRKPVPGMAAMVSPTPNSTMAPFSSFVKPKGAGVEAAAPEPTAIFNPAENTRGTPEYKAKWIVPPEVQAERDVSAAKVRFMEMGGDKTKIQQQVKKLEKGLAVRGENSVQGTLRAMVRHELAMWKLAAEQGEE